jgi:hypothetical protein
LISHILQRTTHNAPGGRAAWRNIAIQKFQGRFAEVLFFYATGMSGLLFSRVDAQGGVTPRAENRKSPPAPLGTFLFPRAAQPRPGNHCEIRCAVTMPMPTLHLCQLQSSVPVTQIQDRPRRHVVQGHFQVAVLLVKPPQFQKRSGRCVAALEAQRSQYKFIAAMCDGHSPTDASARSGVD